MERTDFTTSILVDQSPKVVFSAINRPQDWWSGDIDGTAANVNDEFVYRYKDLHFSRQRVVELVTEKRVVWLVTESSLSYADDKNEWTGTRIIFEISKEGDRTNVRFTHQGLHEEVECYESCSTSWTRLLKEGLFNLISTGTEKKIVLA